MQIIDIKYEYLKPIKLCANYQFLIGILDTP